MRPINPEEARLIIRWPGWGATIIGGNLPAMILTSRFDPAARLRTLLLLLLLTLGLLAGVSLSQTRQAEAASIVFDERVMPAIKQVHALSTGVDELRGLAALHLLLRNEAERAALEGRLQAGRHAVERLFNAYGKRLVDDTDRQHHAAVQASLARFWVAQDQLLAASRRAPGDPAGAALARALLTGESQQAYVQVRADLDAWWAYTEAAAAQAAQQARAAAHTALWLAAAGVALAVLSLAVAMLQRPQADRARRRPLRDARKDAAPSTLPVDSLALQQHLAALNAAVAAARRGEPGRAAGLSAQEAQRLADQVDAAARGLRALIDRPASAPRHSAEPNPR